MQVDWRPAYTALGTIGRSQPPDVTVHAARVAIEVDPAAPLDLDALAAVAGYAKHHFVRRFATVVGQTPGRYQTGRRMELARRLLETTDLDVTTICHRIGYASLGSFSDAFHRVHGRPPSAWRRRSEALAVLREEVAPVPSCFLHRHASAQEVRNLGEAVQAVGP